MNKFISLAVLTLACGAYDDTTIGGYVDRPRYDGSIEDDGVFENDEHKEEYCRYFPDSMFCSDMGSLQQLWTSAEYHGTTNAAGVTPCYGSQSANGICKFPKLKQMKIVFNTANCYDVAPVPDPTPPLLKVNKMITAWKNGMKKWHGRTSTVTVEDGVCSWATGCETVNVNCANLGDGKFGQTSFSNFDGTRVSNLPVGPHGEDQTKADVYSSVTMSFNPLYLWKYLTSPSLCGLSGTDAQIESAANGVGAHEQGHGFGFGHMQSGVMKPNPSSCQPTTFVESELINALFIYNSSAGAATVSDQDVENIGPNTY